MLSKTTRVDRGRRRELRQAVLLGALVFVLPLAEGCADSIDGGVAPSSAYSLDTSYTTSVAATDAAWSDDWGAVPFTTPPSAPARPDENAASGGESALLDDGGVPGGTASDPVAALRSLARGATNVCPGSVTVEPVLGRTPCGSNGQPGTSRVGALVTFSACELEGGGRLDGTVSVKSRHSASDDACDGGTTIMVEYKSKITNLVYASPSGRKVVIESLSDSGKYHHAPGTPPSRLESKIEGRIRRYDENNDVLSDHDLSGSIESELEGVPIVVTSTGTYLVHDAAAEGGTATVKQVSLEHVATCCPATDGTITTSGAETETFAFGPACGAAMRNTVAVSLGDCP